MRHWVLAVCLGCTAGPEPEAPPSPLAPVSPPPVAPAPPEGPSRADVLARLGAGPKVSLRVLGTGWTHVGTHRDERVLKPVCGGEVPHLGLARNRDGGRLHVFDGHRMSVHDILGLEREGEGVWRIWLVPVGAERPVHGIRIVQVGPGTTRWRGEAEGPAWADGADWMRDREIRAMMRVEQLQCRP